MKLNSGIEFYVLSVVGGNNDLGKRQRLVISYRGFYEHRIEY
jgi:hypothetical protein